jgi:hypothetical protein
LKSNEVLLALLVGGFDQRIKLAALMTRLKATKKRSAAATILIYVWAVAWKIRLENDNI